MRTVGQRAHGLQLVLRRLSRQEMIRTKWRFTYDSHMPAHTPRPLRQLRPVRQRCCPLPSRLPLRIAEPLHEVLSTTTRTALGEDTFDFKLLIAILKGDFGGGGRTRIRWRTRRKRTSTIVIHL